MEYKSDYVQSYDLIPDLSTEYAFYTIKNEVNFLTGRFVDASSLVFIDWSNYMTFFGVELQSYVSFTATTLNNQYGLTTVTIV